MVACLLVPSYLLVLGGCELPAQRRAHMEPLRMSELVDVGDPARRASQRLVVVGLEADEGGDSGRARGSYERAIQVDATNPYAYLALARHEAERGDPSSALSSLSQADALLRAQGGSTPRVEPHLYGLRGQIYYASGRFEEGAPLLEEARSRAPSVWSDGRLTAGELR